MNSQQLNPSPSPQTSPRAGRRLPRNTTSVALLSLVAGLLHESPAAACKCAPPSLETSFARATDVATVRVLTGLRRGEENWYFAVIRDSYKGCLQDNQVVLLTTPSSTAACGVSLVPGGTHLIAATRDGTLNAIEKLTVQGCDYNVPLNQVTAADRQFLEARTVCCGDQCACSDGSMPVSCLVDPCAVAPACEGAVDCVANYCGGCNAEFFDTNGARVCTAPPPASSNCSTDADCRVGGCSGQLCESTAREALITTCEFREEFACFRPELTSCGCIEGVCSWARTPSLAACLSAAGVDR